MITLSGWKLPPDLRVHVYDAKEGIEKPLSPEPIQRVMDHSDQFGWGYYGKAGSVMQLNANPAVKMCLTETMGATPCEIETKKITENAFGFSLVDR